MYCSNWHPDHKILLYSARGFGRAGSILVSMVLASNPIMPFSEVRRYVAFKWPTFIHTNLQKTLEELYPRS